MTKDDEMLEVFGALMMIGKLVGASPDAVFPQGIVDQVAKVVEETKAMIQIIEELKVLRNELEAAHGE